MLPGPARRQRRDHRPVFCLTPEATPSWSRHTEKSLSFPVTLVRSHQLLRDISHVKSISPGAPDELRRPGHTRPVFPSRTGAQSPAGASTSGKFWALGSPQSPLPLIACCIRFTGTHCLPSLCRPLGLRCFRQRQNHILCDVFTHCVEASHLQSEFFAGRLDQVTDGGSR